MLPKLTRGLRLALVIALSLGYVSWHGHYQDAFAKKGGDDGDDDGGDDDGGDDGGDSKGGGDDEGGGDDDADDKDQPPVTSGGLYTMATYPVREISRPLTITQGVTQIRLAIGTDLSAKGAFGTAGLGLEGTYGLRDNFEVFGGFTDSYNFKGFSAYAGFEGAIVYDVIDIRLAANLHRNAFPEFRNFCTPPDSRDPVDDGKPGTLVIPTQCAAPMAELKTLPNGTYHSGGMKFSLDLGFPFRYAIKPEIAIVALQTLMSIDFNGVDRDYVTVTPTTINVMDPMTMMPKDVTIQQTNIRGNGVKPDLNPSLGIATNPIPPLSVVIFAQLRIPDFDTEAGAFQVPVTGRVEFSPSQKLDVGLEFILLNVKPPDGQSPIDNRYASLFMQARF